MERTGLFDRDVCLKLAWCGLWDEALVALGITRAYRLASCTAGPSNRKALRRKIGDGDVLERAMARLDAMVATTQVVPYEIVAGVRSSPILADLQSVPDVDGGEALLTAIIVEARDSTTLISGDKRFFTALREQRPEVWAAIAGRVLSFEHCLLAVMTVHGSALVIDRVRPLRTCDSTLDIALGSGPTCDGEAFKEALASYDPLR